MRRVMIVDDEFLVRIGIKSMLDWAENGYLIVGEAVNGQDAIEKIPLLKPEILLTDLVMEPVNGLELIEYCQANYPGIKLVVLSNYDDFDKVKAAMKLGASDYLLKLTTRPEELLAILGELSQSVDARRASDQDARDLLLKSAGAIRQRVLRMLLEPELPHKDALLDELKLIESACALHERYAVLLLRVANFFLLDATGEARSDGMFSVTLENAIDEIVREHFCAQVFAHERGQYYVAINLPEGMDETRFRALVGDCFEQVNTCVERYFGMCVLGALSGTMLGPDRFSRAADQCAQAMRRCFTQRENKLLGPEDAPAPDGERLSLDCESWALALSHFHFAQARAALGAVFAALFDRPGLPVNEVREALYEFYRALKADAEAKGLWIDDVTDRCGQPLFTALFHYDLLRMIEEGFAHALNAYEAQCGEMGLRPINPDIARVLAYVKSDLKRNVGASQAAKLAHMSESYFSRFFKRNMGVGFVDYVNRLRIERAKALLAQTERRIGDVASDCGVENPNYFSILFKKQTGMTPIEYRNSHIRFE